VCSDEIDVVFVQDFTGRLRSKEAKMTSGLDQVWKEVRESMEMRNEHGGEEGASPICGNGES